MSRLFLIRHGQASFLSDNYDQLSDTGENQAQALGEQLTADNIVFDAVFSGDLVRQVGTAEIVSNVYQDKKLRFPLIKREVGLNEYPAEEIMTTLGKYLIDNDTNASDLFKKCNDAEDESDRHKYFQKLFELILEVWVNGDYEDVGLSSTWEIWSNQVRETLMKIMENSGKGKLIAVFTSGGPIGVSVQTALSAPEIKAAELNWRIYNCSVTKYTFNKSRFSLDQFNDVSYLPKDLLTYR